MHYMYVDIRFPLTKAIPVMFQCSDTHYQTLQTSTDHDATHCHNFNALPHALRYVFSKLTIVWDYFLRNTKRCFQNYKRIFINNFFKKITVPRGNKLQMSQNQANLKENIW